MKKRPNLNERLCKMFDVLCCGWHRQDGNFCIPYVTNDYSSKGLASPENFFFFTSIILRLINDFLFTCSARPKLRCTPKKSKLLSLWIPTRVNVKVESWVLLMKLKAKDKLLSKFFLRRIVQNAKCSDLIFFFVSSVVFAVVIVNRIFY